MKTIDARINDRVIPRTKKYSKRQIKNAIKFWTMVLENKSPLIDDLITVFGYYYVFMGSPFIPSQNQLNAIYNVVNVHLFNNSLQSIPFILNDELCAKQKSLLGYVYEYYTDDIKRCDVLITEKCVDSENIEHYPPMICVSKKFMNSRHLLISLTSLIAHEMIHQYCVEKGNALKDIYECREKNEKYNVHGDEFSNFMNIANSKHGLNIRPSGTDIIQMNIDAMKTLDNFAGNDYMMEDDLRKGLIDGKEIKRMFIA